jgi:arginyl-tRNA synthetase
LYFFLCKKVWGLTRSTWTTNRFLSNADNSRLFTAFNVIKGFLNLTVSDHYFTKFLTSSKETDALTKPAASSVNVMVEYSSPNTNKPLHLGHLRNNFLGWSVAEILKSSGNNVMKTCIVNDRGVHICKSMLAWKLFGDSATPESTGLKGDHLVGDYYVRFSTEHKRQINELIEADIRKKKPRRMLL